MMTASMQMHTWRVLSSDVDLTVLQVHNTKGVQFYEKHDTVYINSMASHNLLTTCLIY